MAMIQRSSVNFPSGVSQKKRKMAVRNSASAIFSYRSLNKSTVNTTISIRESTQGSALMAAIFAGQAQAVKRHLLINEWLPLNIVSDSATHPPLEVILRFRKALDLMLSNAFSSLAKRDDKVEYLADDPLMQDFASTLTLILEESEDKWNERLGVVDSAVEAEYRAALEAKARNAKTASTSIQ